MWRILKFLQKNLVWSIPVFMIAGLAYGKFFETQGLKQLIVPLTFFMVYPMMVTMNIQELFRKDQEKKVQPLAILLNFAITPFIGFFIGKLFFSDAPLIALGLLLTSLLPTSGMTISWTGFAKGNVSAAVKMTIIGLIIGSLATPFYLKALMGTVVTISLADVFSQIVFIVFLPLIAGYLTQVFLLKKVGKERFTKSWKPNFPLLSTVGVLGVVFVSMALKSRNILSNPSILIYDLLPLLLLYGINFLLSTLIAKYFFDRDTAIAFVYGTVMRNLSIALAIAMGVFGKNGSEIALIIALAYIIQVQAAAWYVKYTDKIFGVSLDCKIAEASL